MKSQCMFYLCFIVFAASLSACGGSSGGNVASNITFSANSTSSASSSDASSVAAPPVVLAPDNQTFSLDEDANFKGGIKVLVDHVAAIGDTWASQNYTSTITTANGGLVKLLEFGSSQISFSYNPPEDFNGTDEAFVYLSSYNSVKNENTEQKIKIILQVKPVADENVKFKINNKKVFSAGEQIQLSLPYFPDTKETLQTNISLKLSIDAVPLHYSMNSEGITFSLPSQLTAGVNQLKMEIEYQGKSLSAARVLTSKIDYGNLEYWMGDKGRAGVTYVVFAENTSDRKKYLEWVNKEFTALLDDPLMAQYSSYWNLAVVKEPSPESYAYISSGEARVLIGDLKTTGEAYVRSFVPNVDWIILNTGLDGRATGGYPMTINFSPISVIMHEFGHVHAKLADEYTDETVNANPNYIEGSNPNVTLYNDYDSIPWKHWILDKTKIPGVDAAGGLDGIGAFLGAFYTSSKFYRPMLNSLMRDTSAPLGAVNSEAWVLATYERLGLLASVTSTKESGVRKLSIAKQWNKNLTQIDWYLNGVKQDSWTNKSSVTIDESTLTVASYTVKAELTDLLGYIKNPNAYASFNNVAYEDLFVSGWKDKKNESFQKTWTFEKTASTKLQKTQSPDGLGLATRSDYWTSHTFSIRDGQHQITASSSYSALDTLLPVTAHSELRADILDASGAKIYSVGIDRPYFYYHESAGLVSLKDKGAYKIKHPFIEGNYQINIVDLHSGQIVTSVRLNHAR